MTEEQAMIILTRIAAAYPRFELSTDEIGKERIRIWLEHLTALPYEAVSKKLINILLKNVSLRYRRDTSTSTRTERLHRKAERVGKECKICET